jgi:flagellar FliJ protein
MAEIRFRLATVLKLRVATRDRRRAELAEAERTGQSLFLDEQLLAQQIEDNQRRLREAAHPGLIDVNKIATGQQHHQLLAGQRQSIQRQRQQLEAEIEVRRQRLVEADSQVRALEILRQRGQDRVADQDLRQENHRLDEVSARCSGIHTLTRNG